MTHDVTDQTELVRRSYAAYENDDREALEALLSPDFIFTSPYDDHIDRATYFERCWPNHERIHRFHIESIAPKGREAFVLYECELKSGNRFRNAERFVFRGTKIERVEVFFGDPPTGVEKDEYLEFVEAGLRHWKK